MDKYSEIAAKGGMVSGTVTIASGWLASVDWIAAIGALVLVASFIVNLVFKIRADRREQERHAVEMARLRKG